MGGIGKTQLAVEFAHRYGRYFRGVHWINAAQPEAIAAEIALCGMQMVAAWGQPWPAEQPEQVAWTLATWQRQGAHLVIFDNLEDPEVAEQWLGRLSAGATRGPPAPLPPRDRDARRGADQRHRAGARRLPGAAHRGPHVIGLDPGYGGFKAVRLPAH